MVQMLQKRLLNEIVSSRCKKAVAALATPLAIDAGRRLAAHSKTGEHRIEVDTGKVDTRISLVGEHAAAVEFGHGNYTQLIKGKNGRTYAREVGASEGLHIIGGLRDAGR